MLSDRLGYLLKHVQARLTEESRAALEPYGLDGRDLAVLSVIAAEDPLSQLDVAARLGVDRTSIGDLLDTLEERDLIERRRSPEDRRRNLVALTAKGETVLDQAERIRANVERKFLAPLGKAGAERFRADLQTLLEDSRQD
jgi:DNA-binding MarR family transcriptional regulator